MRNRSNQSGINRPGEKTGPHGSNAQLKQPRSAQRPLLTADRLLEMTTVLAEQFYRESQDPATRLGERKHATTAFGIVTDKWLLVSGRPTAIHAFVQADRRAGVLELAARLASSAKASA